MARTRTASAAVATAAPPVEDSRIEYVRLDDVARWPRNAKKHDKPGIRASFKRFGWIDPVIEDMRTGRLVAGHGRLETALEIYDDVASGVVGIERPRGVKVDADGMWMIPVLRGVAFTSEHEAEAYLLANNRLVEVGGYDEDVLREILNDHREGLDGTGYSIDEVTKILDEMTNESDPPGIARDEGSDELPGANSFAYDSQYGVIVMCDGELNQKLVYERFVEMGYKCKVVVV